MVGKQLQFGIIASLLFVACALAASRAGAACTPASQTPVLQVLDHGWKSHVYHPWLETKSWFVEADEPDVKGFQYTATVRNNAGRPVKEVVWEYQFLKPEDGSVVSQHSFRSESKIKPGSVKELKGFSVEPPTYLLSAKPAGDGGEASTYVERVAVRAVVFDDGTQQTF